MTQQNDPTRSSFASPGYFHSQDPTHSSFATPGYFHSGSMTNSKDMVDKTQLLQKLMDYFRDCFNIIISTSPGYVLDGRVYLKKYIETIIHNIQYENYEIPGLLPHSELTTIIFQEILKLFDHPRSYNDFVTQDTFFQLLRLHTGFYNIPGLRPEPVSNTKWTSREEYEKLLSDRGMRDFSVVIPNTPNIGYCSATNKRKYNDSTNGSASIHENHVVENLELVSEEIAVQPTINLDRLPYYKCNKTNLKHILNNDKFQSFYDIINDIVKSMHVLRMLTTHIIKLYILYNKFTGKKYQISDIINVNFIITLIRCIAQPKGEVVTVRRSGRPKIPIERLNPTYTFESSSSSEDEELSDDDELELATIPVHELEHQLLSFIKDEVLSDNGTNNEEIKSFMNNGASFINNGIRISSLQNTCSQIAREIVTSYENNIIEHYKKYVERFVNIFYKDGKQFELEKIANNDDSRENKIVQKNLLLLEFRKLKDDLVEADDKKVKSTAPSALEFIKEHKKSIFPKSR